MSDALLLALRINLALAAAVAVVLVLRRPTRRLFGAGAAYALWALAPLAALAMIAPARVVTLAQPQAQAPAMIWTEAVANGPASHLPTAFDWMPLLAGLWIAGAAFSLMALAWQQARFARAVRAGRGGPAVVGVLRPRIVTPDDFAGRYTAREQTVVLAHERTHIARHDSRINAAVALARCLAWFNPFVHLLAHYLRIDQELACDAAVVAKHPTARRAYAEALLKTQLAARPLPIGCYWPAQSAHPLAQRIGLLSARAPGWARLGPAAVGLLIVGGACGAWALRPAEVVLASAPATPSIAPLVRPVAAPSPTTTLAAAPQARPAAKPAAQAQAPAPAAPATQMAEEAPPLSDATPGLMPEGLFGPSRKFHAVAEWSAVEPGSAVRVLATMTDPEGIPLVTDLTAFGSQSWYRVGYIRRGPSRYKLFTSVVQHGDRLLVTAGLDKSFRSLVTGSVELASGETGTIRLPSGQLITVTPTLRPETPEERAAGRRNGGRPFVNVERVEGLT